jgi:hypothetical protein
MTFREVEMINKVVLRFADGSIIKGTTADFFPGKDIFHLSMMNAPVEAKPVEINTKNLKAIFFVKDFAGDQQHVKRNEFDPAHPPVGRKIRVEFKDDEVLVGTTTGYQPGRSGFFILPADTSSNNERCYVFVEATKEVSFI